MNIALLGSSGQLGSWLIPPLEAYGHVQLNPGFDIREPDKFYEYCKDQYVDAVLNAAGLNNKTCQQLAHTQAAHEVNGQAVGALALACRQLDIPFYHLSTEYVFGPANRQPPFSEEVMPLPDSLYGRSKLMGDIAAISYGGHVLRVSLLPDHFPYEVAATNIISSKLRASIACSRVISYISNGLPGGERVPVLHICGERRSIADFVRDELGRTDVRFEPLNDGVDRPLDSSLCSIYQQDIL